MQNIIWELESDKIRKTVLENKRLDERAFDEYRPIELTTNISHNADGSCQVKLGKTEVMVGVKSVLGTPYPDKQNEGSISVNMEFLPIASPEFEYGPPSSESIETARVVDRGLREAKALDFTKLCIIEGEKIWVVFLDIYTLNQDGNLFDASSIGCLKALSEAKLPKLDENNVIIPYEYDKKLELKRHPLLSTFVKIGNSVLVDPTLGEEKASSARFSIATTEDDYITAFQKGGKASGSFSVQEIDQCIETAFKRAKELRKKFFGKK
ncbi:exosome complex protein Rrp42 [Candidatus Micrarchaeota archaeon]|nr:exosome complex protein Rrp42 [Candidatus Micrarchaeota archaeon]MBU1930336.1 exosome complex protein Rrp42 [Candidatus Micrarchaeota archaeon]